MTLAGAGAVLLPRTVQASHWEGDALGRPTVLTLEASTPQTSAAFAQITDRISARIADLESLFATGANSLLDQLNRRGRLESPPPLFLTLLDQINGIHRLTDGRFDPTVAPLLAQGLSGAEISRLQPRVGWRQVYYDRQSITLGQGQMLTLSGIAPGFVADQLAEVLASEGVRSALIDLGEARALGGPWPMADADGSLLRSAARSVSRPRSGPDSPTRIIGPDGTLPLWRTVTVEADSATLSDGLSTGLALADRIALARILPRMTARTRITLEGADGVIRQI